MDEETVENFIKSHRAKLELERSDFATQSRLVATINSVWQRLTNFLRCRTGGILPEGRAAEFHQNQLRRERQEEYRAFLLQQKSTKSRDVNAHNRATAEYSLADKRKALTHERQQELKLAIPHGRPPLPPYHRAPVQFAATASDEYYSKRLANGYDAVRKNDTGDHELADKDFHQLTQPIPQERQVEESGNRTRQVHFEPSSVDYAGCTEQKGTRKETGIHRRNWDQEEEGLIQWARGQSKLKAQNLTPPTSAHLPDTNVEGRHGSTRSLSAPVAGGIATLGAESTEADKKRKQKEYAEQLIAQMREKQMARERTGRLEVPRRPDVLSSGISSSTPNNEIENHIPKNLKPQGSEKVGSFYPERENVGESLHMDSKIPRNLPQVPQYWYYGGYPYIPPAAFPPNFGLPYYPPLPSLPPHSNMNNPYFSPYYPTNQPTTVTDRIRETSENTGFKAHKTTVNNREKDLKPSFMLGERETGMSMAKAQKEAYRVQLTKQIHDKQEDQHRERLEVSEFERKKEQEVYDPFGKGGCGAPIRDRHGQLVTDLKQMKKVNDERMMIGLPSTTPLPGDVENGGAAGILDNSFPECASPQCSYDFRRSKELRSKSVQEDYREVLEQQMKEREEIKEQEKKRSHEMEKLEQERIEKELKILDEKYRLEKESEKELKLRNEAIKREQEERERDEAERKREEELKQLEAIRVEAEKKKQAFIDNMEQQLPVQSQVRSNSPPIPTLRKLKQQFSVHNSVPTHSQPQPQPQKCCKSPPVPTLHHQQLIGRNGGGQDSITCTSNDQPLNSATPLPARTITATTRSSNWDEQENTKQTFSACVPAPIEVDSATTNQNPTIGITSRSDDDRVKSSRSAQPTQPSDPYKNMAHSVSEPHQPSFPPKHPNHVMEDMLQSLRSVLEIEKQKVTIPNDKKSEMASNGHDKSDTDHRHEHSKPDFWKARLAGSHKSKYSHSLSASNNTAQHHGQGRQWQRPDRKHRTQWKLLPDENFNPLPSADPHLNMRHDEYHYTGSREDRGTGAYYSRNRDEGKKHPQLPSWLEPTLLQEKHSVSGDNNLPPQTNSPEYARPPSIGRESQFSVATLDVESMACRNEERMRRLEKILNSQARDPRTPQAILADFLSHKDKPFRNRMTSGRTRVAGNNQVSSQRPRESASLDMDYENVYPHVVDSTRM